MKKFIMVLVGSFCFVGCSKLTELTAKVTGKKEVVETSSASATIIDPVIVPAPMPEEKETKE